MKGRHLSTETKERIKNTLRGRIFSDEWKDRLSQAATGRQHTRETKEKLRMINLGKWLGENNPNWAGGITSLYQQIRGLVIYKLWREAVFIRDSFQCQDCGKIGSFLHAHHIRSFEKILKNLRIISVEQALQTEELWDVSNGVTLCIKCHKKRHKQRSKTLEEEIENFVDNRDTTRRY